MATDLLLLTFVAAMLSVVSAKEVLIVRAFDEVCWTLYEDRLTPNSKLIPGINTLAVCKKFCVAKSQSVYGRERSCNAIEWDIPSSKCYAIFGRGASAKAKSGRYHYTRGRCEDEQSDTVDVKILKSSKDQQVLAFSLFGQDWTVSLRRNTVILGDKAEFTLSTRSGKTRAANLGPSADCFWIGTAESGEQESGTAAFTICGDKFRGYITTLLNDYEINAYSSASKKRSLRDVLFRERRAKDTGAFRAQMMDAYLSNLQKRGDPKKAYGVELNEIPLPSTGRATYYEMNVIMDGPFFQEFKEVTGMTKYKDGLLYMAELVNFVQAWYLNPTFGFRIWLIVSKAVLLEGSMPINKKSRMEDELLAVCRWQGNAFKGVWDATIFLTGDDSVSNGPGLAIPFSACDKKVYHCGSVPPNGIAMANVVRTFAHEAAHTMGMIDLYASGSPLYYMCYHGVMRDGAAANTWSVCSVQMYERWLHVTPKTCVTRGETKSIASGTKLPIVPYDVAWRAKAKMSSVMKGNKNLFGAWKATDGSLGWEPTDVESNYKINKNPKFHSCALSKKEKNPWLVVELYPEDVKTPIFAINIINYWDKGNQLKDFEVRVGNDKDFTKNPLCYKHEGDLPMRDRGSMWSVKCRGEVSGRYVSIQIINDKAQIAICEVQVMQDKAPQDFKSTFKCQDTSPACFGLIKGGSKCNRYGKTCQYSCGKCKRTPQKAASYPGLSAAKIECKDQDAFVCSALSGGKLCSTRRAIQTCSKTCGQCGKAKLPALPALEPNPTYDPNCLDKSIGCKSWIDKNPKTCELAHLAKLCHKSCKKC